MLSLGLKGNDLLVYAILYGFTMGDRGRFLGDLDYLAEWTGTTTKTVREILRRLEDRGLIICEKVVTSSGWHNEYKTTDGVGLEKSSKGGFGKNSQEGLEKSSKPHVDTTSIPDSNIYNNKNLGNKTPAPTRGKTSPFNFREALISIGVTADVADAWIAVRKTKRATNTKVAFEGAMREIEKAGASADDCIRAAVEQSWSGFRADWYARLQTPLTPTAPAPSRYETVEEHNRRVLEATRRRIAERYGAKEDEKEGER